MEPKAYKLKIYGFPEQWVNDTFDTCSLSGPELDRIKKAFGSVKPGVCYVQGNVAPVVNQYIELGVKIRGVDMTKYIDDPFDQQEKEGLPKADVVVLYNVSEGTTSIKLAQQVISKVLQKLKHCMVIMQGDRTGRAFSNDLYKVKNFCSIPEKEEEKWL